MPSPPIALTIAGLDPSSGAGLTADLKTFAAHHVYGMSCATALTVQSTRGVRRIVPVDGAIVRETLECLVDDVSVAGIKIGMLGTGSVVEAIATFLEEHRFPAASIVLDPVLLASSGAPLLDLEGLRILRERLLSFVGWITPNTGELATLLDEPGSSSETIPQQAARLQQMAARAGNPKMRVVVTGGHLEVPDDYFLDGDRDSSRREGNGCWVKGERVHTTATHGTGCAFSSALLCQVILQTGPLGMAQPGRELVSRAKAYVTEALRKAYPIGQGRGPMNHLFRL